MFRNLIFLLTAVSWSGLGPGKDAVPKPIYTSMIQLIANPDRFDGKHVVVFGFLDFDREADLLFVSKDEYENVILTDTLWVDSTEKMGRDKSLLNRKFVRIDGTFRAGSAGRYRFAVGGITDIRSCTAWSDPSHPAQERMNPESSGEKH